MKEASTGEFSFEDNEYALWRVFEFLYKGDYSEELGNLTSKDVNSESDLYNQVV